MIDENGTPASTEEETTEEVQEETVEELKARLAKAEEERENQKRRAEKAEKKAKEIPKQEGSLNQNDLLYIAKTDIHEDDLSELNRVMTNMGMSAKEAHDYLKPRFAIKAEERNTAQATATGSGRGKKPKTGDDYLAEAQKTGEIPTDDSSMQDLILARQRSKHSKK